MVFDRVKYKNFAKKQLKDRWVVPVMITLTTALIMTLFSIPDYLVMSRSEAGTLLLQGSYTSFSEFMDLLDEASATQSSIAIQLIELIVDAILGVAALRVYLQMSRSPEKVSYNIFIEGLNNWWKAIVAFLWQFLWILLWSFLFIIPGIIKAISYSQTYYIINEFEDISIPKAMRISMLITRGHKAEMFMTYLSFIGWILIGFLTLGIGFLWIKPYMNMTFVNVYHALMKEALETGLIRPEDLK